MLSLNFWTRTRTRRNWTRVPMYTFLQPFREDPNTIGATEEGWDVNRLDQIEPRCRRKRLNNFWTIMGLAALITGVLFIPRRSARHNWPRPSLPLPLPMHYRPWFWTDGPDFRYPARLSRDDKLRSLYRIGEKRASWLDHILSLDEDHLAPGTHYTQQYIHEWQNPPLEECKNRKFYRLHLGDAPNESHGLGSTIHYMSHNLQIAMQTDRILAWGFPDVFGGVFVEEGCGENGTHSLDCVFEPLTICPQEVMNKTNTIEVQLYHNVIPRPWEMAPHPFVIHLKEDLRVDIQGQALKYWWRGQAAAYFMRLNQASMEYIRRIRLNEELHSALSVHPGQPNVTRLSEQFPFPLPPRTISMHVRHGDKAKEMDLHPFTSYVKAGELLATLNPQAITRNAFISSEDPAVIEETKDIADLSDGSETTPKKYWTWYTSNIGRINSSPFEQLHKLGNRTEVTLSWMSELMLAMECDGFIGTRGSNWNRVIDEVRCIWIDSCSKPYIDVGEIKDWKDYSW